MDLIDTADIAADLNLGRDYVTRRVVKRPELPPGQCSHQTDESPQL